MPTFYFGDRAAGASYIKRPSAYAIVPRRDDSGLKIAVVITPCGYHLPGGGIDPGESPEAAAVREMREETGLAIACTGRIADAIEMAIGDSEGTPYKKLCVFLEARLLDTPPIAPVEPDHELRWISAEDTHLFSHEVHRWAVEQWIAYRATLAPIR